MRAAGSFLIKESVMEAVLLSLIASWLLLLLLLLLLLMEQARRQRPRPSLMEISWELDANVAVPTGRSSRRWRRRRRGMREGR